MAGQEKPFHICMAGSLNASLSNQEMRPKTATEDSKEMPELAPL
jgi:hypothetical protein